MVEESSSGERSGRPPQAANNVGASPPASARNSRRRKPSSILLETARGLPATAYCPGGLRPEYRRRWRLSRPCSGWERVGRRRSSHRKPSRRVGDAHTKEGPSKPNVVSQCTPCSDTALAGYARGVLEAPSAIRTARLHALRRVHPRPIKVVVYHRPYPHKEVGGLISGPVSRLDAVSASPSRTTAAGQCPWRDNPHTGGPSAPVLSYWGRPPSSLLRPQWIETELSHDVLNPARVPL